MKLPIYFDNQATTAIDPRVLETMVPYLTEAYGNAASRSHSFGWAAEKAVETGRQQVASLIGASPKEIIFTSGATESNNLAIQGVVEAARQSAPTRPLHIITQSTEHKAVLDPCAWVGERGCRIHVLPVTSDGCIILDELRRSLDTLRPALVSIMFANNEIGTIQAVEEIGRLCHKAGALFHTDAAQAVGKLPIDVIRMNIDLLSISAHKIYGPKGIGALYVRRRNPRVDLIQQIHGGGHERGIRSGTLNVPGIVGFGTASRLAETEMDSEAIRLARLRDGLQAKLQSSLDDIHVNGSRNHRLPGNLNVTFRHVDAESIMTAIGDIAISSGSACTSASIEPSHVLRAIGLDHEAAHSSLRISLGRFNTQEEIDYAADRLIDVVTTLRNVSSA